MKVRNRSGEHVDVHFDAIQARLQLLACSIDNTDGELDLGSIVHMTIKGMHDGITTSQLDGLSAQYCASQLSVHPAYDDLAGRIVASDMHKNLRAMMRAESLSSGQRQLQQSWPDASFSSRVAHAARVLPGTHNPDFVDYVRAHADELDAIVDYSRDFALNYFALRTMECSYLLKDAKKRPLETPQDMLMRVSIALHMRRPGTTSTSAAIESGMSQVAACYDMLSRGCASHATPTLFNAGMRTEQYASCFLLGTNDSLGAIFKTVADCAQISKWAGGIGVHVSNVRGKGSRICGTNGESDGIIPMLKVFNETARYCNQSGKRKGSIAVYLEPWHSDVWEFIELRRNTGAETQRARDLFLALWVPDAFMRAVEDDQDWYLMSPDRSPGLVDAVGPTFDTVYAGHVAAGRYTERIRAKALWLHILTCQLETGMPYLMFKDHVNRKSNQRNLGTIRSSNLCVASNTQLLTRHGGYLPISGLKDKEVEVWNGHEWSATTVRQTGVMQPLLRVLFHNGEDLDCTPYHRFTLEDGRVVQAKDLMVDSVLRPFCMPPAASFSADGDTTASKLRWLQQATDTAVMLPDGSMQQESCDRLELVSVKRKMNTLGADGAINKNEPTPSSFVLTVPAVEVVKLVAVGFILPEAPASAAVGEAGADEAAGHPIKVCGVFDDGARDDTYCFDEPLRHMGVFNGILTNNCAEITEYSDADTYAVCTLGSIAVNRFFDTPAYPGAYDFAALHAVAKQLTRNLDKIVDLNEYPTPEARISNLHVRPIGVGVQGLGDLYCMMRLPYDEEAAMQLDSDVMETIYHGCLESSIELADEARSSYPGFAGSPFSKGLLQFDLWDRPVSLACPWLSGSSAGSSAATEVWDALKARIVRSGIRNSLLTALMPTATTSQLLGNSECFEPCHSNLYKRTTLAGEHMIANRHLVRELRQRGLWSEQVRQQLHRDDGSVQRIDAVPDDVKLVYRTVWEVSQRSIVDHALRRGPFVDQSQSMNLYFAKPNVKKLSAALMYGWAHGIKTGCYYVRGKSAAEAIKHGAGSSSGGSGTGGAAAGTGGAAVRKAVDASVGAAGASGPADACQRGVEGDACTSCGA